MSDKAQQSNAQQFEHAIATAFTCRSVIKYNSSLSEEQKNELVADIDTMLKFLRNRAVTHPTAEAHMVFPQSQQVGIGSTNADKAEVKVDEADDKKYKQKLAEVYRISQFYLYSQKGDGTSVFMARFREAMATIDEIQAIATRNRAADLYPDSKSLEDLLQNVRGLIADVYSLFIEFARAISHALQGSGIYIDTEELSLLHLEHTMGQAKQKQRQKQGIRDISPLLKVYKIHMQLDEKKGTIASRIDDATAFLMFLGENLDSDLNKRDTIVAHLNKVARLLNDLSYLLSGYESTISALLAGQ